MKNDCVILTNCVPVDRLAGFLHDELPFLAKKFRKVYLVPLQEPFTTEGWVLPAGVQVLPYAEGIQNSVSGGKFAQIVNFLLKGWPQWREDWKFLISNFKRLISAVLAFHAVQKYEAGLRHMVIRHELQDSLFYSYWNDQWVPAILRLKLQGFVHGNVFTRVHGYDLYFDRGIEGYLPFRTFICEHITKIFCCCDDGRVYLKTRFPAWQDKLEISRLGVEDLSPLNSGSPDGVLRIVSCSFVTPIKRVNLILEALIHMTGPVEWTHIGDGPSMPELRKLQKKAPGNVLVNLLGMQNPDFIQHFYQKQPIDIFINTSLSEGGSPVSIMEAIRFGIPTVATEVGGNPDIVGQASGYLIPLHFRPEQLLDVLRRYANLPDEKKRLMRLAARKVWSERFDASRNYSDFADRIALMTL